MNNLLIWFTNKSYHLGEAVLLSLPEIFCNRFIKSFVYPNANEAKNLRSSPKKTLRAVSDTNAKM